MLFKTQILVTYDDFLNRLGDDVRTLLEREIPRTRIGADIGVGAWESGYWGEDLQRTFIIERKQEILGCISKSLFANARIPDLRRIEMLEILDWPVEGEHRACAKLAWEDELSLIEQDQFVQVFPQNNGFRPYIPLPDTSKQKVIVKERVGVSLFRKRDEWLEFENWQAYSDYLRGKTIRPKPRLHP